MSLRSYLLGLIGLALLGPFTHLWAWGGVGHQTVAYIAEDHLSPSSQAAIKEILGLDEDLASISTWADLIVQTRKETAPWHYIDLNVRQDQNEFDEPDFCPHHDCVVDQIGLDLEALKKPFASRREKQEALKFLVHFVGDLHQPLHCANDKDRGGNEKWFRFYSRGEGGRFVWVNLHSFWDDLIEEKAKEDPRILATRLEREIGPKEEKEWAKGQPTDWAYESFQIAKYKIYSELPEGPLLDKNRWGRDLPDDYYSAEMRKIVDRQLEKAGMRLAFLLNQLFGKH
jgi:hypothetical protein